MKICLCLQEASHESERTVLSAKWHWRWCSDDLRPLACKHTHSITKGRTEILNHKSQKIIFLQSQVTENTKITSHRQIILQIHRSQSFLFGHHRSQTITLSQVTDLFSAFSQITDFKKAQSQVTEIPLAPPRAHPPPPPLTPPTPLFQVLSEIENGAFCMRDT